MGEPAEAVTVTSLPARKSAITDGLEMDGLTGQIAYECEPQDTDRHWEEHRYDILVGEVWLAPRNPT
jgi:hypothetical protein